LAKVGFFGQLIIPYFYIENANSMRSSLFLICLLSLILPGNYLSAQKEGQNLPAAVYDLSVNPVLYAIGYECFDIRNREDYPETIKFSLKTLLDEDLLFLDKNKNFSLNLFGACKLQQTREYYPERYDRIKKFITRGRIFVSGSAVSGCDDKIPSPESMIRQVLYGNNFFRTEFGKESRDFMLYEYYGYSASLPSLLAHCGLKEFSIRQPAGKVGTELPFTIGNWIGPDGKGVLAILNSSIPLNDSKSGFDTLKYWENRILENGKKQGVYADCHFFRMNEAPGILTELSKFNNPTSQVNTGHNFRMLLSSSDQISSDITDLQRSRLPEYSGDLGLPYYPSGSLTAQSCMKRWNRKNELLAEAAEPLAALANWLGGLSYPYAALNQAWWLVLKNQRYDILNGGSSQKTYEYAWNDEVLSMNKFASVLESAAGAVIRAMDTRSIGKAIVVYNPVALAREDVVEVTLQYPDGIPENVGVIGPDGKEVLSQLISKTKNTLTLIFLAKVPGLGLTCFDVRSLQQTNEIKSLLSSGPNFLENEYYKVLLNASGDVSSITDKKINKELLSAPARLEFLKEHPERGSALNMDWNDRKNPPLGFVDGTPKISILENGPVRSSLKIERTGGKSRFNQIISLTAGEGGKRIAFRNTVEWQSKGVSLKASFPTSVSNKVATYNLGLGTIERPVNSDKNYEVPTHEWIDLTDKSASYGISILNESKYGSDFPNEKTLRLTLLYTPSASVYPDQATLDWGTQEFNYSLFSHKGDWKNGRPDWQGRFFNQPLLAFQVPSHPGFLGNSFPIIRISSQAVDVRTIKNSESGNMILIRLQELVGKDIDNVIISFPGKIVSAYETDAQERKTGEVTLHDGKLDLNMKKYEIRSIAVKFEPPAEKESEPVCFPQPLVYDQDVVSSEKNRNNGKFDKDGYSIPAEQFPDKLKVDGIDFTMGKSADGQNNALVCRGQKILLPKSGNFNHLYLLASAIKDTNGTFRVGDSKKNLRIQKYKGFIGQSDKRIWDKLGRIKAIEKGFIKKDEVAWFCSHMHKDSADQPYRYCYIFKFDLEISPASGSIQLPDNEAIKVFAITLADDSYNQAIPVHSLVDDFSGRKSFSLELEKRIVSEDFVPKAKVNAFTTINLNDLPCKVTMKDYADLHSPNGVTIKYFYTSTEKIPGIAPVQGQVISASNDGMFDLLPSDSVQNVWFEQGEGRLLIDLQQSLDIDSIHFFSSLDSKHGPQVFSLWASGKMDQPVVAGDPRANGWNFLVRSSTPCTDENTKVVYTLIPKKDETLNCRYLLCISEESGHGPYYFREVDVFEKQK
jgi:alpha-mannosidase